jgi:hypothetical protein
MSLASTTVFLYAGMNEERQLTPGKSWVKVEECGHIELVNWLELMAFHLERQYDAEFAQMELDVVFDYEITEPLGAWLYHNPDASRYEFAVEARRLVEEAQTMSRKQQALWAENDARL